MDIDVHDYADQLRQYATHFAPCDWNYTRDTGDLVAIRYDTAQDRLWWRIRRSLRWLFGKTPAFAKGWSPNRFYMARHALRRDTHMPDGVLAGGGVITFREETGEYLQYVQPSVGALFADLMDARPDLPEVQAVAVEMKRINDNYGERVAATEGD